MALPAADDTITISGVAYDRFAPVNLKKPVKDGTLRCISCGQIDDAPYHEAAWCPGAGGYLPFPTSTITIKLKADSGYRSEIRGRTTLAQWQMINAVLASDQYPPAVADKVCELLKDARGEAEPAA